MICVVLPKINDGPEEMTVFPTKICVLSCGSLISHSFVIPLQVVKDSTSRRFHRMQNSVKDRFRKAPQRYMVWNVSFRRG